MNDKTKTAGIAVLLNGLFTLLKFILYSLTGSLAVLADAWHSLSDIATSLLLLYSFLQNKQKPPPSESPSEEEVSGTHAANEVIFSLLIGFVLLIASALIYRKGSIAIAFRLSNTVPAGIFFIFFAFCSYALSRFEERVGKAENSIGLLADASHSKADMFAALLTGLSLILHAVGLNLDKPVAYLIATLILVTAIETITNSFFAIAHKDTTLIRRHKIQDLIAMLLSPATWSRLLNQLARHSNAGRIASLILKASTKGLVFLLLLVMLTWVLTSSYYVLDPSQAAIVERCGVPLQKEAPIGPGLHFKLPWPIDQVKIAAVRHIHTIRVGPAAQDASVPLLWTRQHGYEEPFLSADNSFFYPYASVNYTITNLHAYLFSQQNPGTLIKETANQIITREFLSHTFYDLATRHRATLETQIASRLQTRLNQLTCGVQISDVFLRDIHPPIPIAPAFENVIAAYQEKEQLINEAYGYRNDSIPQARGNAALQGTEADAYSRETVDEAAGRTRRKLLQLAAYKKAPAILHRTQYFTTMKKALAAQNLVLIDPAAGAPDLWVTDQEATTGLPALPRGGFNTGGDPRGWENSSMDGPLEILYEEEEQ